MFTFFLIDRRILFRGVCYCGLLTLLLALTYVLSIGPAYAYLINHFGTVSEQTSDRILSFYSPIYYPCNGSKPFYNQLYSYITFWRKLM
ncbi:hypothetical protein Mal35_42380 [Gimesia maris]|uniref:hypothetical protein n=1 Tax=Gimesia maris TaxID=122 RepID=UPI0011889F9A|nr:hypothetical protein [Gimesia maris]QDT80763.1 hypothetical protein Mal35_42380 [Gimesia maris]